MEIETMDDAIEYASDIIGDSFQKAVMIANSIIDSPSDFTGPQAAIAAAKLAVHRYRIGLAAQHWKLEAAKTKKLSDRLIKDSLMSAYAGLEEVINTLKIIARQDHDLASTR